MLVDGMCALAMLGGLSGDYVRNYDGNNGIVSIFLAYNFCAFVLQFPIGIVIDGLIIKRNNNRSLSAMIPFLSVLMGIILTITGAFLSPVVLGIGNALFHAGGGVGTIKEDNRRHHKGADLGIFVAPGALGLFLGGVLGRECNSHYTIICIVTGVIMLILAGILYVMTHEVTIAGLTPESAWSLDIYDIIMITGCFFVVVLRSYLGLGITMEWKTTVYLSLAGVLAVVAGKMTGGILSAVFGMRPVVTVSLIVSTAGFLLSSNAFVGIIALFAFNMTMPVTLYILVRRFPQLSGFFFGLLTMALFVGYLPVYFDMNIPVPDNVTGAVISVLSMIILLIVTRKRRVVV